MGNIYLVGMMGSGKSSVAKCLAEQLGRSWIDVDEEIVKASGQSINTLFEKKGETVFRQIEKEVLARIAQQKNAVVATGGGSVLLAENRERMKETGVAVYLKVDLETLFKRVKLMSHRPLLKATDPKVVLAQLLRDRETFYQQVDIVLDGSGSVEKVCQEVLRLLNEKGIW